MWIPLQTHKLINVDEHAHIHSLDTVFYHFVTTTWSEQPLNHNVARQSISLIKIYDNTIFYELLNSNKLNWINRFLNFFAKWRRVKKRDGRKIACESISVLVESTKVTLYLFVWSNMCVDRKYRMASTLNSVFHLMSFPHHHQSTNIFAWWYFNLFTLLFILVKPYSNIYEYNNNRYMARNANTTSLCRCDGKHRVRVQQSHVRRYNAHT